ncbi:uncharacterized protein B0H18DRAFT_1000141 [Fomitopsis serialis]|uniref:uncharacterized protein n=1 Tax=Fomitopsis serialis TaxID=139415 RepID=UPI00200819D6|nr:uncharacterized protein B0H18DRAFT_1000141 [Neoantrodia serialis]KAH9928684.1 hypothetical protein B0H18DRAFT_1000141 [Neoantrodia serialis]
MDFCSDQWRPVHFMLPGRGPPLVSSASSPSRFVQDKTLCGETGCPAEPGILSPRGYPGTEVNVEHGSPILVYLQYTTTRKCNCTTDCIG